MEFIKPATVQGNAFQTIKGEVATALEGAGMPRKAYITISDAPIAGFESVEGTPSPSAKDGRIMYNFGGKSTLRTQVGRLQGNFFLPKDGWTVDAATHKAYVAAKTERDKARSASKVSTVK